MSLLKLVPVCPVWTQQDSAELRQFIATPFGQKLFNTLLFNRPGVSGYCPEQRRVQSDERAGYEACIGEILFLAEPTEDKV